MTTTTNTSRRSTPITTRASALDVRRVTVGLALAVTAAIHVLDLPGKVEETPYLAVAYIFLIVAAVVLLERMFRGGVLVDYLAAIGLALGILVAFVVTRTVGLPGAMDDIGNWLEPLGLLSLVVEAFVVWQAAAAVALLRRRS